MEGKAYHVPEGEGIKDVIEHLDSMRPTYTLLYFTANWNPMCAKIERDYEALASKHASWHHIRVDCDAHPKLKRFFDARVEPQFLMLLKGGEVHRQVGYNFEKIGANLEKIQEMNQENFFFFGDTKNTWERFYDEFDKWSRYGEHDRDSFRANLESNADQWRGPGTN